MGSIYVYEKDMADKDCTNVGLCGPLLIKDAKYEIEKGVLGTLTFTHVKDDPLPWSEYGKWKYLEPGRIVKAMIPVRMHEDYSEQMDMRFDEVESNGDETVNSAFTTFKSDIVSYTYPGTSVVKDTRPFGKPIDSLYPGDENYVSGEDAVIFNGGGYSSLYVPARVQTHTTFFNALKAFLALDVYVNEYIKPLNKPENKVTLSYLEKNPNKVVFDEAAFNKLKWCLTYLKDRKVVYWDPAYNKNAGAWREKNEYAFPHLRDTSVPAPKMPKDEKFTKIIRPGDCGPEVALLQKRLIYLGFLKQDDTTVLRNQYQYTIKATANKDQRKIYKNYKGDGTSGAIPNPSTPGNPTICVGLAVKAGSSRVKVKVTWKVWDAKKKVYNTKTNTGWIERDALDPTDVKTVQVINGETEETLSYVTKYQLFRIQSTSIKDSDGGSVEVTARPIAYDLVGNLSTFEPIVYENETIANVTCAEECTGLLNNTVDKHNFKIHSNILETRFARDYVNQNVLNALIDTQTGVLADWYGSQLLVDDEDLYIINNAGVNRGKRILYSKDLTGIQLDVDYTEAYSAVRPKGQDKDGYPVWIDGVERTVKKWEPGMALTTGVSYKYNGVILRCIKNASAAAKQIYIQFETNDYFTTYTPLDSDAVGYIAPSSMNADQIKKLNNALRTLGYTDAPNNGTTITTGATSTTSALQKIQQDYKIPVTGVYDKKTFVIINALGWKLGLALTVDKIYRYHNKSQNKYILKKCIKASTTNEKYAIEFRVHTEYVDANYQFFANDDGPTGYTEYYYGKSNSGTYFGGSNADKYLYKLPAGYKFYKRSDGTINGTVIMPDTVNGYEGEYMELPYPKIKPLDVSDAKEGSNGLNKTSLMEVLVAASIEEFKNTGTKNSINKPKTSLKVEFAFLGNTEEFAQYKDLDKMFLYDPVYVGHKPLDMHFTMQCVKFEFDPILERMNSAEFGTPTAVVSRVASSQLTAIDGQSIKMGTINAIQIAEGSIGASSLNTKSVTEMTMGMTSVSNICYSLNDFKYSEDPTFFYMDEDPALIDGIEVKANDVWCCTKEGATGTYLLKLVVKPDFVSDPDIEQEYPDDAENQEPSMARAKAFNLMSVESNGTNDTNDINESIIFLDLNDENVEKDPLADENDPTPVPPPDPEGDGDEEIVDRNTTTYEWVDVSDTIQGQTARSKVVTTWTNKYDQVVKEASKQQQHLSIADNGAIVMTADFQMDTDGDGTQEDYHSKMILDSGAIRFNIKDDSNPEAEEYSSFTTQYVQFGNYMLKKTTEGGMAFIFVNPEE